LQRRTRHGGHGRGASIDRPDSSGAGIIGRTVGNHGTANRARGRREAKEVTMQQIALSEIEQRVYEAVAALEARGQVPFPSAIAEEAGLPEEQLATPLHDLGEKNLLHREDSPMAGLDFGPRWCARQPA
jgi:hypothetical protein